MSPVLLLVLVCWNLLTLVLFAYDKAKARRGARRVPEAWLLWAMAATGCVGGWLGMSLFRHKAKKLSFRVWAVLATAVNALWVWLWLRW